MKKVLIIASVVSFIEWFNKQNIEFLRNVMQCEVHIACNFDYMEDTDIDKTRKYIEKLKSDGIILHNIHFARNPFCKQNISAYVRLADIIKSTHFDLIHCHTPAVSMMTRIAARRTRKVGTVVMYTCHGFHFHNSSLKRNWLIYYPIEKYLSRYCDYLVTINKEDYNRAKTFHCKNVRYIPGVGVDINKIERIAVNREEKRSSIGVPDDAIILISAGELIERKNHEVIIRAIARINNPNLYYVIAGKGQLKEYLNNLAKELGVADRVIFLGFRTDIYELYHIADISAFPSKIEGLGISGIEAMAAGIPLISSNVHGILDYVINEKTGYTVNPNDVAGFADAISKLADNPELRTAMKDNCINAVKPFEVSVALDAMWNIYKEILR